MQASAPAANIRLVGIGASAGGLEALRELMESLPESRELSYVIAQHVSPTHVSMLMNLLAPLTALAVMDLSDKQAPAAGTVYITPPNKDVVLKNGLLRLTEPQQAIGPKPSVNHFFHSLADELGERAIGIILSGTGSDGAAGLRAIKAAGGITIAQEPDSAKYDGMPKAAIHTGSVDLILRPAEIGPALDRLVTQRQDVQVILDEELETDEYAQIRNLVRLNTAFRLSDYKAGTVRRRIARRMNILGVPSLTAYIDHLRTHKEEAQSLVRDTFISVTSFFRDAEPFAALERLINDIVKHQTERGVIRCWVPGCASGEEAYSIAILFEEALRTQGRGDLQYMIFASDLDDDALEQARSALYPVSELESVPKALRDRHTELVGGYYRLLKSIRNRLVFARQNVIEDPPFARLDLISCRNVMIYLIAPVQQRVLEVFHYSLNPGGHLFLGKSESADAHRDLFKAVDARAHIYSRLEGVAHYALPVSQGVPKAVPGRTEAGRIAGASTDLISMRTLEDLAERYAPPSLVINEADTVVHFHGNLKPYLHFPKGRADMYLFDLLDSSVRAEMRALVYRCRRDSHTIEGGAWTQDIDGKAHVVTPVVTPLEPGQRQLLLISFQVAQAQEGRASTERIERDERDSLIISELEQELANTRTHLNIVVEQLETSNEELQSLNEELQSTNEELQSTNEELQTSNEELQSTNEELLTVNEEMQVKSAELEATASDLTNVKQSLTFPLIVVDSELRITQANAACSDIVAIDSPLERSSLTSVQWLVDAPGLPGQVRRVIQSGALYQAIVETAAKEMYQMHVMPYRRPQGEVDGAVLLFQNITAQFAAEEALKRSNERYDLAVRGSSDGLWDWDIAADRTYLAPRFKEILGFRDEELDDSFDVWRSRLHPDDREAALAAVYSCLQHDELYDVEYRLRHKRGDYIWVRARGLAVRDDTGKATRMAGSITDINAHKQADLALRASEQRFRLMTTNIRDYAIFMVDMEGRVASWNEGAQRIKGYEASEIIGQPISVFYTPEDVAAGRPAWLLQRARAEHQVEDEGWRVRKDGSRFFADVIVTAIADDAGEAVGFAKITRDVTTRRVAELALRESEERNRTLIESAPDPVVVIDEAGVIEQVNQACETLFGYDRDELVGRNVSMLMPSPHREAHDGYLARYVATGEARIIGSGRDVTALRKDGSEITIHLSIGVQRKADGRHRFVGFVRDLTERVRAETALRDSELKYRIVADNTHDWEYWTDAQHCFLYSSPSCLRITGHESSEFLANPDLLMQIVYPEDRQAWAEHETTVHRHTGQGEIEFRIVMPDGGQRWIGHVCQPVLDEHGSVVGRRGSNRDITDKKEIEAAIRRSEARFRATINVTGTGYVVLDTAGRVVDANEAYVHMTQHDNVDSISGRSVLEWTAPEALNENAAAIERTARDGCLSDFETTYQRADGSRIHILVNAILEQTVDGPRLAALCRDITDRTLAATALRQSEQRLQELNVELERSNVELRASRAASERMSRELETIIDALPGLVFYKDAQNRFIRVNRYFADAHHTNKHALEGRSCFDLYPQTEAQAYWNDDQEVMDTRMPKLNIAEPWDTDSGRKWLLTSKIPQVEDDKVQGVIGVSLDITTLKQQEEELLSISAELQRSNAELEQFAYVASHDLRSPLRAIESLSEWLEHDLADCLSPESAKHLQLLRKRTRRMEALLDSLLEYSRAGRVAADVSEVDCGDLVHEIADSLGLADRFTVSLGELPRLTTARTPFEQVLRNLISNAAKHHDKDRGSIAISAVRRDDAIEFAVADDGPGIPDRYREKVFGMFQTLKARDEIEGSGMGLALVKKIVERYGGSVRIGGALPRGTEVRFTWPLELAVERAVRAM